MLNKIAAIALLVLAAIFAGGAVHEGLIGKPPLEVALLAGLSILLFGLAILFGMLSICSGSGR